jgi:hypothetical protein
MTCFWVGLLNHLSSDDLLRLGTDRRPSENEFVRLLQNHNRFTPDVTWNGQALSAKQLDENKDGVAAIQPQLINQGYDCSTFEPVLFLLADLLQVTIIHNFNGTLVTYQTGTGQRVFRFASDHGHFWKV